MAIKALVFDCGGVLLAPGDTSAYAAWEHRLGLESGELAARLWQGEPWTLAEVGKLTADAFWQRVGSDLGLSAEETAQLRQDLWGTWEVNERVLRLVDQARERYRLAVLTNASDEIEAWLAERFGLADRFELVVNSARVGVAKPEPAIYEELLRRLELEPREVLFIDDQPENVAAAASLGMHVAWYVNAAELERQLRPCLGRCDGDGRPEGEDDSAADDVHDMPPAPGD